MMNATCFGTGPVATTAQSARWKKLRPEASGAARPCSAASAVEELESMSHHAGDGRAESHALKFKRARRANRRATRGRAPRALTIHT